MLHEQTTGHEPPPSAPAAAPARSAAATTTLMLDVIRTDGGTQPRASMDYGAVDDYTEAMKAGTVFPPALVFYDGSAYWLADGFHRYRAAERAGITEIACDVRQGTREDAQWSRSQRTRPTASGARTKTSSVRSRRRGRRPEAQEAPPQPGGTRGDRGRSEEAVGEGAWKEAS